MKIEFTKDEMGMLTAIVLAMSEDVENGKFDKAGGELAERAKKSFSSLSAKVLMANLKLMTSELEDFMNSEILDEEE